ncbi:hypothetical protein HYALB_00007000 [Hymenoscyphus albidus]|uniref:Zn(2)-C6 fungal-type domain-containing protein n=1 Tax=Hymenoscyphus albidus TaxID=595503 RepID=A0A9N9Q3T7_9HELO|nr:hypothetical protein HYALB_00007000 [Hymenoscyphus albidus]
MSDTTVKVPKRRASTPRSKKGCITCKIRRLKCGEERPGCVRCAKSGWTCDGYQDTEISSIPVPSSSSSNNATLTPLLPRSSSNRSVKSTSSARSIEPRSRSPSLVRLARSPSYQPQASVQLEHQELQYFQAFVDENSISLLLESCYFWKSAAVAESKSNPCIRHALVALGALITSAQKSPDDTYFISNDSAEDGPRQFALLQHEKAIRCLREAISNQNQNDTFSIILSCLVLVRLESFIGNGGFVMQHLRYARKLVFKENREGQYPTNLSLLGGREEGLNEVVMRMFFHSDLQALAIMGPADEDRSMVIMDSQTSDFSVPLIFRDLREAKRYYTFFCEEGYMFWYRNSLTLPGTSWEAIPQFTIALRDHLIRQLHLFLSALSLFVGREPDNQSCHPLRKPSSLKLGVATLVVLLTLTLNSMETAVDVLQPHFQYMVNTCREVLDYEARFHQNSVKQIFSFECRVVGPLFVAATKCRDGNLRRQAISLLLSSHRREMMMDSLVMGSLANWIMTIEEEGMDVIGFIPDESRAWGQSMSIDLRRKVVIAKCGVGRKAPGQWIERITELPVGQYLD